MSKGNINIEDKMNQMTGKKKFRFILGGICFVAAATFVMIHLGFVKEEYGGSTPKPMKIMSLQDLWLLNAGLGILGGMILDYRHFLIAGLAGLIANLAITGAAILYLSWRTNILTVEIILPLLAGLIGIFIYNKLIIIRKK